MRGRKPVRPLAEIADAAVEVFTRKGFRPAGISDVARALGLSHGALYTYVDSKQALLHLALVRVLDPDAVEGLALPLSAPPAGEVVAVVRKWAADRMSPLAVPMEGPAQGRSVAEEFGAVVDALYAFIEGNQRALQLVERCADQLPELTQWYFVEQRRGVLADLGEYLAEGMRAGRLRPAPSVPVAARFVVETIAWFAMHRHGDPDSAMLTDEDCRAGVRHLLVSAFVPLPADAVPTDQPDQPDQWDQGNGRR